MNPRSGAQLGRSPVFLALLLLLAFAVSGWKVFKTVPAANFASGPQVSQVSQVPPAASVVGDSGNSKKAVLSASRQQQRAPDGSWHFDAQFVSAAPGQAVHAASIVELANGALRAVWFSGSREGAGDVTIQTAVMDAKTLKWAPETTLFDRQQIQRGLWRYVKKLGNPVIARAPDGSLFLWMVNVSVGGWAGSAISWSRSVDDGISWSPPRRLVTSPFLNVSTLVKAGPVAFANGQMGLPVYHESFTKFAELLRLSPDGQVLDKIRIAGSQRSLQPVVLVSGPEQAQVYMRSGGSGVLMASVSTDAGKTWSSSRPAHWPNPDSAVAGMVTSAAGQWLALNPTAAGRDRLALLQTSTGGSFDAAVPRVVEASADPKTPLSVAAYKELLGAELKQRGASQEQAEAYIASATRQLCSPAACSQELSYPYLLQTRDGYIHLVYTWNRTRIKHVRFDPLQAALPANQVHPHAATTD